MPHDNHIPCGQKKEEEEEEEGMLDRAVKLVPF